MARTNIKHNDQVARAIAPNVAEIIYDQPRPQPRTTGSHASGRSPCASVSRPIQRPRKAPVRRRSPPAARARAAVLRRAARAEAVLRRRASRRRRTSTPRALSHALRLLDAASASVRCDARPSSGPSSCSAIARRRASCSLVQVRPRAARTRSASSAGTSSTTSMTSPHRAKGISSSDSRRTSASHAVYSVGLARRSSPRASPWTETPRRRRPPPAVDARPSRGSTSVTRSLHSEPGGCRACAREARPLAAADAA